MKTGGILVLYQPDWQITEETISSLATQVDDLCIVDNTPDTDEGDRVCQLASNITYFPLYENLGIAAAQNIGIQHFMKLEYDFVVFCDQDSVSPDNLIPKLKNAYFELSRIYSIAAIGPMPLNKKTGTAYLYPQEIISKECSSDMSYYIMHSLISSYSLVPVENFKKIGIMQERLFIDFVDQEWCWRANNHCGMVCILYPEIRILHELGVSKRFCGVAISVSTPFRLFYQTRNLLWLCKVKYVPNNWKKRNVAKLIPKFIYYTIFTKERLTYMKEFIRGLYYGLTKRMNETD